MEELSGKVAVVTGGASGIGRALVQQAAAEGMKVAVADIEVGPLEALVAELRADGAEAIAVPTDVADLAAVEALRDATLDAFGAVHLVCNNAGVGGGGKTWETPIEQWRWVIDVDLWGVIHGIHTFVPLLVEQGAGHVVNTASIAGLTSTPFLGPYSAAKHGVVTLSETLFHELRLDGIDVGVTVLCPSFVATRIHEAARNAPAAVQATTIPNDPADDPAMQEMMRSLIEGGMPPVEVAAQVFDAVRANRFYVLTHPETPGWVRERMERIASGEDPAMAFG